MEFLCVQKSALHSFLDDRLVRDVVNASPPLKTLKWETTVFEALEALRQWGVLASVVMKADGKTPHGFIDMVDLVVWTAMKLDEQYSRQEVATRDERLRQYGLKPVRDLVDASSRDHYTEVPMDMPLRFLIAKLAKKNVHRVAAADTAGTPIALVSQYTVVKYLYEKCTLSHLHATVDMFQPAVGAITIPQSFFVIDAFKAMYENDVSGLAVVSDKDGAIVSVISATDLKRVNVHDAAELVSSLYCQITEFKGGEKGQAPVYVQPTSTLGDVLWAVVSNHIHRVFVVDENKRPLRVLSLSDILKTFV